jgi:two-component SAPR family response regulator
MKVIMILITLFFVSSIFAKEGKSIVLEDKVRRMFSDKDADKVMFQLHAAVYVLKKGKKNYEAIKKGLEDSQTQKKDIQLKVDAETLEIEELMGVEK